jgi:imidazole glycerol phosphate synthase glutamine amidotransferase subunit
VIVPTGTANIASVAAAVGRLGFQPEDARRAKDVTAATGVIVPGVGAFGAAVAQIDVTGLRRAIVDRVEVGRPTLFVCVGMQLLCASSEESPGTTGLGIVADRVERFDGRERVPQMGWNRIDPPGDSQFLEPGWAYFANSYRLLRRPAGWSASTTNYGGVFVSTLERGNVLACQFHPELSGPWGAGVMERWLSAVREAA